ncbi:MAG: hypothetical protein RL094_3 [Candidatus Parcubacteria bacterium]|jgi:DNA repair protein RecO
MSHHIYQTEGFIIEAVDVGEANKLYTLFTKDLGLIRASAQGVRFLKSKLRYSLQELSFSSIAVVRGKEMWRITSARKLISLFDKRLPMPVRKMLAKVLMFTKRMMPEEGKNEEIFKVLSTLSASTFSNRELFLQNPQAADAAEVLAHLYILKVLGYGTARNELTEFLKEISFSTEVLEKFLPHINLGRVEIDKSLEESHL